MKRFLTIALAICLLLTSLTVFAAPSFGAATSQLISFGSATATVSEAEAGEFSMDLLFDPTNYDKDKIQQITVKFALTGIEYVSFAESDFATSFSTITPTSTGLLLKEIAKVAAPTEITTLGTYTFKKIEGYTENTASITFSNAKIAYSAITSRTGSENLVITFGSAKDTATVDGKPVEIDGEGKITMPAAPTPAANKIFAGYRDASGKFYAAGTKVAATKDQVFTAVEIDDATTTKPLVVTKAFDDVDGKVAFTKIAIDSGKTFDEKGIYLTENGQPAKAQNVSDGYFKDNSSAKEASAYFGIKFIGLKANATYVAKPYVKYDGVATVFDEVITINVD